LNNKVDLTFTNLHFTARPLQVQRQINQTKESNRLFALSSIHHGCNNDWPTDNEDYTDLWRLIGSEIGSNQGQVIRTALSTYSPGRLRAIAPRLLYQIKQQVEANLTVPAGVPGTKPTVVISTQNWGPEPEY
jgi:hypothetical protein